jgi:cytochrome c peroxidase
LLFAVACAGAERAAPTPPESPAAPPGPDYTWVLPPGFPEPFVPADNPMSAAKVELGRRLFYDARLSVTGAYACASCHQQARAFTDGRARAVGATGELHPRSAPSLANAAYSASFGWADPTLSSLEAQARVPMFNRHPVELGLAGLESAVLSRLRADPATRRAFAEAFPGASEPVLEENLRKALAAFERTLFSGRSPYDRLVYEDDRTALGPTARAGMRLFFSERLGCPRCHAGFTFSGPVRYRGAEATAPEFHDNGLRLLRGVREPVADGGLFRVTGRAGDLGRFRAPTLRNVALTAPYMHDGSLSTLDDVIEHSARAGRRQPPGGRLASFSLEPGEAAQLRAFLEALSDEEFIADPRFSRP